MDVNVRSLPLAVKRPANCDRSLLYTDHRELVTLPAMPRKMKRKMKQGASEFAQERAALIREARENREPRPWSQTELAKEVGVTRETVYQWESAGVEQIDLVACVRIATELGLELADLLTVDQRRSMMPFSEPIHGVSPQAKRIARIWDKLPVAVRQFIWNAVEAYTQLERQSPYVAQTLVGNGADAAETGQFKVPKFKEPSK